MVSSLQRIFERAKSMPEEDQEFIASLIEDELADEERWQAKLRASIPELKKMEKRAKEQYDRGECLDGFDHE